MTELNPSFTFDLGPGTEEVQAPWEFSGALKQALKPAPNTTSIDQKIRKRLAQQPTSSRKKAKEEFSSEEDSDDDDDSDAPLPGEEDDEDVNDEVETEDEEMESDTDLIDEEEDVESDAEEEEDGAESLDDEKAAGEDEEESETEDDEPALRPRADAQSNKPASNKQERKEEPKTGFFARTPEGTSFSARTFGELNLSRPLVKACAALGYTHPTPIQAACIPLALTGRDISGSAVTGSGKTAAFMLPLLERLLHRSRRVTATYVLVLTPVRELAVQVHSMTQKLAQFTDIRVALVVGGLSLQAQAAALRKEPEIVVGTPGRVIDHVRNTQSVGLDDLQALVLDEADRLLEMGFADELKEIVRLAPRKRQTMLFSATMTEEVRKLIALSLDKPVRLAADAAASAPKELVQEVLRLKGAEASKKEATLLALGARTFNTGRTIVFFSTKQRAHRAKILFGLAGLPPAAELHGDMTQAARLESLEAFRKGEAAFLLATDVAARGLDILGVETVINLDCPNQLATYLHRVGRTARAGNKGRAVTFVEDGDRSLLKAVVKATKVNFQQRQVPASTVGEWQDRIERLATDVDAVLAEERDERQMRQAEMEAQKASNMLEHEDEIYSRPARTWFQTTREKKATAEAAREASNPMTAKQQKNRDKNLKKQERKQQAAKEAEAEQRSKKINKFMEETGALVRTVKAVKAKEKELRGSGIGGARAGKMAADMISGAGKKKSDKRKKKEDLFTGDGLGDKPKSAGKTKVYAGGAMSTKPIVMKSGNVFSKTELARIKRGGKGRQSFKSKARHKRR